LFADGKIAPSVFVNINNTAVLAKEFEEAKLFVQKYKKQLPPKYVLNLPKLCISFSLFHQKEYKKALDALPRGFFFEHRFVLMEKSLAVRCLYECAKEDENLANLFESELNSYEAFIGRSSVMGKKEKKRYLRFVYIMKRILRLRMKLFIKEADKKTLLVQLCKNKDVFSQKWLEKITLPLV